MTSWDSKRLEAHDETFLLGICLNGFFMVNKSLLKIEEETFMESLKFCGSSARNELKKNVKKNIYILMESL